MNLSGNVYNELGNLFTGTLTITLYNDDTGAVCTGFTNPITSTNGKWSFTGLADTVNYRIEIASGNYKRVIVPTNGQFKDLNVSGNFDVNGTTTLGGNTSITGNLAVSGTITGNLSGTASTATNALNLGGVSAASYPLDAAPTVRVRSGSAFSIPNDTDFACPFSAGAWDMPNPLFSTSSNTRLTAQVTGKYLVYGTLEFAANNNGYRRLSIRGVTGDDWGATKVPAVQGDVTTLSVCTVVFMDAGNYVQLIARQNSGGALNGDWVPPQSASFGMSRISA